MLFDGIVACEDELAVDDEHGSKFTDSTHRVPAEAVPDWEKKKRSSLRAGGSALEKDMRGLLM